MADASPLICKELESVCVVDKEGRDRNLSSALARGLPTAQKLPARTGRLAIVAAGPSVRDHLEELRSWPGEVWAINGAYDYLLDQGIVPHGFFAIDPLPELAEYVQRPHPETTFYIASTADPAVFDALKDARVLTFHPYSDDVGYPEGFGTIGGGTTSVTRAPYLGLLQGWRDITLFGVDSSYDGQEYCYPWGRYSTDIANPKMWVDLYDGGPRYQTEVGLLKQVSQLAVLAPLFNGMLKFKCGGLMQDFLDQPARDDIPLEVEKKDERNADADQ